MVSPESYTDGEGLIDAEFSQGRDVPECYSFHQA